MNVEFFDAVARLEASLV
jgi:hypothetical protein